MRKAQKKSLIEITNTLYDTHKIVQKYIEKSDNANAIAMLAECQDATIALKEIIEKSEGKEFITIDLFTQYNEALYDAGVLLSSKLNGNKIKKNIDKALMRVVSSIENDIKVRLEVVFMPYKTSMWDSLESIWKAANEDPDCDAYVVPIPYYDRNSDCTLGKYHYEGNDYPDYVPIVRYDSYSLEKRRPDAIYIHNPYDANNLVTSVAPEFYSTELKKYTDMLVYTPYFVTEEPDPLRTDITLHYITPGVINANKVILQSENMRNAYINVLCEKVIDDRKLWEERILGLGSSKYDKVFSSNENNIVIPERWKEIINRVDGKRKKIIFYNVSIGSLLADSDKMMKKIRDVLIYFYDNRDKVTLLWRPHPLLKSTINSMRPQLLAEYESMVAEYVSGGWGIYDDTPDLNRAISISDAYYGDSSSVVNLYEATGKPILLQNVGAQADTNYLVTDKMYYDGQYIWSTSREINGLFRIDLSTYKVEYVGQFVDEQSDGYRLFYDVIEHNGKIYCPPYNAKNIGIYDKAKCKFYSIPIKEEIKDVGKKFAGARVDGKHIYIQGSRVNSILRLDTETDEVDYIENWVTEMKTRVPNNFKYYLKRGCTYGRNLYYPSPEAHGLLKINLDDLSHEFIPLQYSSPHGFANILSDDDKQLWLLPEDNGYIAFFDLQTSTLAELKEINGVTGFCRINEYVYYFSCNEPVFYRVHTKTKIVETFPIVKGIYSSCPVENKIFMTTYSTGELYVFDTISLNITKVDLVIDKNVLPKFNYAEMLKQNKVFNKVGREFGIMNLKNFVEMDAKDIAQQDVLKNGDVGAKIHEYIKELVL